MEESDRLFFWRIMMPLRNRLNIITIALLRANICPYRLDDMGLKNYFFRFFPFKKDSDALLEDDPRIIATKKQEQFLSYYSYSPLFNHEPTFDSLCLVFAAPLNTSKFNLFVTSFLFCWTSNSLVCRRYRQFYHLSLTCFYIV